MDVSHRQEPGSLLSAADKHTVKPTATIIISITLRNTELHKYITNIMRVATVPKLSQN